jgi:bifunctional enzyme CysN/CysC
VYEKIRDDFRDFATKLDINDLTTIPMSALNGDNVVTRSENMPWYDGTSLLHHLEDLHIASDRNLIDVRFPVQYVVRPMSNAYHDYRGYAGQIAAGVLKPGDDIMVLGTGLTSKIKSVDSFEGPVDEAYPPMSVTVRLTDELDISRGDMLCRPGNQPHVGQDIDAMICWMSDTSQLRPGAMYGLKHTTRSVRAKVVGLDYQVDVTSLHRNEGVSQLSLNEIGRVKLRTTQPLFYDEYRRNRTTGSFILIDEATGTTVAAGMIHRS